MVHRQLIEEAPVSPKGFTLEMERSTPVGPSSSRQLRMVAGATVISLWGSFVSAFYLKSENLQEIFFLGLSVAIALQIGFRLVSLPKARAVFLLSTPYFASLWISLVANIDAPTTNIRTIVMLGNVTFAFCVCSCLASAKMGPVWHIVMKQLFWLLAVTLALVVVSAKDKFIVWGRWQPYDMHPNWWGMICLAMTWVALAHRNLILRAFGLAVAVYVLYRVQSRGAMLALIPALYFCTGMFFPISAGTTRNLFVAIALAFVAVAFSTLIFDIPVIDRIVDFAINDIARIGDSRRGIGTGLSGRTESYQLAWNAFLESPIFGTGYGSQPSVHNGFLLVLAESGALGMLGLLWLFVLGLYSSRKTRDWFSFGVILSYFFILLTFPRSVNINLTSMLFVMVVCGAISMARMSRGRRYSSIAVGSDLEVIH